MSIAFAEKLLGWACLTDCLAELGCPKPLAAPDNFDNLINLTNLRV